MELHRHISGTGVAALCWEWLSFYPKECTTNNNNNDKVASGGNVITVSCCGWEGGRVMEGMFLHTFIMSAANLIQFYERTIL